DLIKVDYVVKDVQAVQDKLMAEAARVAKSKVARYENLLGTKVRGPAQVYAEKSALHYPTRMYDSYVAHSSEDAPAGERRYTTKSARKSETYFLNSFDGDGFDAVIAPVITEPVVQATLYVKLKYEIDSAKGK